MKNKHSKNRYLSIILTALVLAASVGIAFSAFSAVASSTEMKGQNGWVYSADGLTIRAKNSQINANASVSLDPDGLFLENRTGLSMTDATLFRAEGWNEQPYIDSFYILYEGLTADGTVYSSFVTPTAPGSYSARLVILSTPSDPTNIGVSSEKIYFYQVSSEARDFLTIDHTAEEKAAAKKSTVLSEDGYYQVSTAEELAFVTANFGLDAKIEITCDIVYNPITVDQNGTVFLCDPLLFNWTPFGTAEKPFTGIIKGNGHTIFGLYQNDGSPYSGLVGYGKGCTITDLTLSDCVFRAAWTGSAGAFVGALDLSSNDGHAILLQNLYSNNCYIFGKNAGGIVGLCKTTEITDLFASEETYTNKRNYLTFSNCVSTSRIFAHQNAGGIIGQMNGGTVVTIERCLNAGLVEGENNGGGIIGEADYFYQRLFLKKCANIETVKGYFYAGGIIGYLNLTDPSGTTLEELEALIPDPYTNRAGDAERYYGDTRIEYCYSIKDAEGWYTGGMIGAPMPIDNDEAFGCKCMTDCRSVQEPDFGIYGGGGYFQTYTGYYQTWRILSESLAVSTVERSVGAFSGAFYQIIDGEDGMSFKAVKHSLISGKETESKEVIQNPYTYTGESLGDRAASCSHTFAYQVKGNRIYAVCTKCHKVESVWMVIDGVEEDTVTEKDYCLCIDTPAISFKKSEGWDSTFPLVRLAFKSPSGKKTYNTVPTEAENFGSVSLEVYTGKKTATIKASTAPISLSAVWHHWEYSADGLTLMADCPTCHAHASVTLNQDGAYSANLNAEENSFSGVDYEVFIDNGWLSQKGIETFYVLYDGLAAKTEYKQSIKYKTFTRPDGPGDYTARLSLVTNPLDPDTAYLSTQPIAYYIATIPASECEIKSYTLGQLKGYPMPALVDGYYQVGTREELLALIGAQARLCQTVPMDTELAGVAGLSLPVVSINIDLTADIIMNPIVVDEYGDVLSGTYTIYNWIPFGTIVSSQNGKQVWDTVYFSGNIRGNGHVIAGLYNDTDFGNLGLIGYCSGGSISDLSLENCAFDASDNAGAFIGYYSNEFDNETPFTGTDLRAINCRISADHAAGGIIGKVTGASDDHSKLLKLCNCVSDSLVRSNGIAGGIIGLLSSNQHLAVYDSMNLGIVQGNTDAGGILGRADTFSYGIIERCVHIGNVSARESNGGIVGSLYQPNIGSSYLYLDNCISIGKLGLAENTGGIIGYLWIFQMQRLFSAAASVTGGAYTSPSTIYVNTVKIFDNAFSQAKYQIGSSNRTFDSDGTRLSNTTKISYICTDFCSGQHLAGSHWETVTHSGCGHEGKEVKRCIICGEILDERILPAHDHQFEYGTCNFCGEKEDAITTASVFINSPEIIIPMAAVIVIGAAVLILFARKKKGKASEKIQKKKMGDIPDDDNKDEKSEG